MSKRSKVTRITDSARNGIGETIPPEIRCKKCKRPLELWLNQYWHTSDGWILCSKGGNHNPGGRE